MVTDSPVGLDTHSGSLVVIIGTACPRPSEVATMTETRQTTIEDARHIGDAIGVDWESLRS
jgi:hypothetical protein